MGNRDVPFVAIGFEKTKIKEKEHLVDLLRIIDNSANDIHLASVMSSPFFNFSPSEMLEIRKNSPKTSFWEAVFGYKGNQNIEKKILYMKNRINSYKKMSFFCNVYELC